jgi:DNA-binding protein WhiA
VRAASFSESVRDEAAATLPERACCRYALLSSVVRTAGSFHIQGRGETHLEVELAAGPAARRLVELVRGLGGTCSIRTHRERRFGSGQRVDLELGGDAGTRALLRQAGVITATGAPQGRPPGRVTARRCCRAAYLRGAFLAGGSVAPPRRPVHLEVRTHDLDAANDLARIVAIDGDVLRVRERARYAVAYTKRLDTVADLLARIGANDAALQLAEGEVLSQLRGEANRQANAETANLRRQVVAARRQLDAIAALRQHGALASLEPRLREAAELRAEHPELTLGELAAAATPPLSKPTLAGRLRRVEEEAEGLVG